MTPAEYANRKAHRAAIFERWTDLRPDLSRIETRTLELLEALEDLRQSTYAAKMVAEIDARGADISGYALDLINNVHGAFLKDVDEAGDDQERYPIDLHHLTFAAVLWDLRAKNRRTAQ
jgi:hypothetical protein